MIYPVKLTPDQNGTLIAEVPDIPGVLTIGVDREDALRQVEDALLTGIAHLMSIGEAVPGPSGVRRGDAFVAVPANAAAKVAIYRAMREAGLTQTALAERLNCDPRQVRRLLDLDHASTLAQLEGALAALGLRMIVDIRAAA